MGELKTFDTLEGYKLAREFRRAGLRNLLEETWKILNGYIAYIKRCVQDGPLINEQQSFIHE
jgi:hypothetical protein